MTGRSDIVQHARMAGLRLSPDIHERVSSFARRGFGRGEGGVEWPSVVGAHAVLFHRKPHTDPPLRMWAKRLLEKKPFKLGAVALADKMARIAFAIMRGKTVYREIPV
jgi:hypothetical protein